MIEQMVTFATDDIVDSKIIPANVPVVDSGAGSDVIMQVSINCSEEPTNLNVDSNTNLSNSSQLFKN
jgi:hypothetical protein